jgi:hypothetical protein
LNTLDGTKKRINEIEHDLRYPKADNYQPEFEGVTPIKNFDNAQSPIKIESHGSASKNEISPSIDEEKNHEENDPLTVRIEKTGDNEVGV